MKIDFRFSVAVLTLAIGGGVSPVEAGVATLTKDRVAEGKVWVPRALVNTNVFGATVPFVTLEGEDGSSNGSVVQLGTPFPWPSVPAQEASGRAFVELENTGEYVEFKVSDKANTLVIRHCIPDASEGGGITASLGLYINGTRVQNLSLSSKFNWVYITNPRPYSNGHDNTPNGFPHMFWDETRFFLSQEVKAGDVIRLQKDADDTAAYYRIDLIELEDVAPALQQPEGSLSIVDYGATGQSADIDTPAIKKCIAAAKAEGKTVWFPAGTYFQNEYFVLDGVKVQGAGMWHTTLSDVVGNAATGWKANSGFWFGGVGPSVSDLTFNSIANTRRHLGAPKSFFGNSRDWSVERVWVTHTGTGMWLAGQNGVIRDCRIRFTYADGINVNNGNTFYSVDNVLVENNHVRGAGDDSIAILAHGDSTGGVSRVTVRHNTVVADWWGASLDMTGGNDHLVHNNLILDGGGFVINLPGAYPMIALSDSLFAYNKIIRCGKRYGTTSALERGALWVFPSTAGIQNLRIENNWIEDSFYHGIHVTGDEPQEIYFKNNKIGRSGREAVFISSSAVGTGTFEGNVSRESGAASPLVNRSKKYKVTDLNNDWE